MFKIVPIRQKMDRKLYIIIVKNVLWQNKLAKNKI
jgi:hypothetical protein